MDPSETWIYHERQEARLCGQHALNNLVQRSDFTAEELALIAHRLDQLELNVWAQNNEGGTESADFKRRLQEGSHHVDPSGNFSIEVLRAALQERYGLSLPHLSQQNLFDDGSDVTESDGFLCHKSDHWFSIRQIGGRFWNLNSTLERPQVISHFRLATEMEAWNREGYTIFCVPKGLPTAGIKLGGNRNNWHRMADLLQGKSTDNDPWENVGSGMRLDGRSTRRTEAFSDSAMVEGLTEEEQLMLALQASLEPSEPTRPTIAEIPSVPIPAEPAQGASGAVRTQIRLFDGSRKVRRFLESDPVEGIYAFVTQFASGQPFELLYGFPPKDMAPLRSLTVGEAKLAGENIQAKKS